MSLGNKIQTFSKLYFAHIDLTIHNLKVNTELQHHLPIIKTLMTTLTKLPKTYDNYRIKAKKKA